MKVLGKKLVLVTLSCILFVMMIGAKDIGAAENKDAESKPWAAPYREIIKEIEECFPESEVTYRLIYFNRGKNPELVAGVDGYWVSMYTYDQGEVYTVFEQWPYGAMGNAGYYYIPKKNVLVNYNSDYAGAVRYTYYGTMKNHELVDCLDKELRIDFFVDKNENGYPDDDEFLEDECVYYYGDEQISEETYDSYCIKGNTKVICGKYSAEKMLKMLQ